ncbi:MAG: serine hydrolase [Planctomycetaceae bacterium]|nr:serine hydrolase [Planctomycetaceae bacterium]
MSSLCSVGTAEDRFDGIDAYIIEAMEKWQVPGLAIGVVKDGETVLSRAYGVRTVNAQNEPVTIDTRFSIASCTKSFTAYAIAILVDEGKLNWDDTVKSHLPIFRVADPYVTEHATIRDLLCHRTNLVAGELLLMRGDVSNAEMLNRLQFLTQAKPFRSGFAYNNLMYDVLGQVIEVKTGQPWQEFVAERLLMPLEMKATTADLASIPEDLVATRHRIYDAGIAPLRSQEYDTHTSAAGAIYSTVGDMNKWLQIHLNEGKVGERQLLSKNIMREMYAVQQSIPVKWRPDSDVYDPRFTGYGLGWFVRDYRGRKVVQHGGAWGAETAILPEEDLAIVVLTNRDWNGLTWMIIFDVIDAYLDGPERVWQRGRKWDKWLPLGGPEAQGKTRVEQIAKLAELRKLGTQPSVPLDSFAGNYNMPFYGELQITVVDDQLHVNFGQYHIDFEHWDNNRFYARGAIVPLFDWLISFDVTNEGSVRGLEVTHIGWADPDERFVFQKK